MIQPQPVSITTRFKVGRPRVCGKFIFQSDEKLYVRGVTYGTFRPDGDGNEFPSPDVVEQDLALMAANGLNALRTYTVPPPWLLDAAQRHGLLIMVGLPVERYVGFLTDRKGSPDIEGWIRAQVRACVGHPAVLCYVIGNEIPAPIVRWLGRRRMERYLEWVYRIFKAEDPDALVTYVNYPSTEYLQLPFLDLVSFNVYLERKERYDAYLARLQNLAGDRPLIITEIGLDSLRHGEDLQAETLEWQIRSTFASGCAGAFVYAWTDEWYRGGAEVDDWDFGLTRRDRSPKPALAAVRGAFGEVPFPPCLPWPSVSVVVCTHNGARTIRECLEGVRRLEYPTYEVIVVDDGSNDRTAEIAREFDVRLICTAQCGLSSARNVGLAEAKGEIVAYLDDDACPDPHWLTFLATTFLNTTHVGVGGPNLPPPDDGLIADCVANAPGGPVHVLLTDQEAEHIPGCNMAFRKACLDAIGGFDPQYLVAGDDVDVCWRIRQRGWTLGFNSAAVVWHHRRNTIRAYWKQQYGYGKAEALLERKWPEKYNSAGHLTWAGRVYAGGLAPILGGATRIYHGVWGSAPFQSLYQPASSVLGSLPLMPEWFLVNVALVTLSFLGIFWKPLVFALPLLLLTVSASLFQAGLAATHASFKNSPRSKQALLKLRTLTLFLHLLQPLARLRGRLDHGLSPWRWHATVDLSLPLPRLFKQWTERWQSPEERLRSLEAGLRRMHAIVLHGGDFDGWDLEARTGTLGVVRMLMAVEEHGGGQQLVRVRAWPRLAPGGLAVMVLFAVLCLGAAIDQAWLASAILGVLDGVLGLRMLQECAAAMTIVVHTLDNANPLSPGVSTTEIASLGGQAGGV